jgi:hypothetical protein
VKRGFTGRWTQGQFTEKEGERSGGSRSDTVNAVAVHGIGKVIAVAVHGIGKVNAVAVHGIGKVNAVAVHGKTQLIPNLSHWLLLEVVWASGRKTRTDNVKLS